MKSEKDKKNINEYLVTVTIQLSIFMTKDEVEDGAEIPHELIVSGCVDKLSERAYETNEDETI